MRSRTLNPGFFKNEDLGDLEPLTRLLFAGLWCMADREGRLEDRPKRIKADILPYDNIDVASALQSLHDVGMIVRYEAGGMRLIQVVNFRKHQHPHPKEVPSAYPPMPAPGQDNGEPAPRCDQNNDKGVPRYVPDATQNLSSRAGSSIPSFPSGTSIPSGSARRTEAAAEERARDWNPFGEAPEAPPADTIESYLMANLAFMSPGNMQELDTLEADGATPDLIRYAVDTACAAGANKWSYVKAILTGWLASKITTVAAAKAEQERHKAKTVQSVHSRASPRQDNRSARYLELAEEMERNGQG